MQTRSVPIQEMFQWIVDAFRLPLRSPWVSLGAAGLTLVAFMVAILPVFLLLFVGLFGIAGGLQAGTEGKLDPGQFGAVMAAVGAFYLVFGGILVALFPPLFVGWYRFARALDAGEPVSPVDIFLPYRESGVWARSVGFAALCALGMVVLTALFVAALWPLLAESVASAAAGVEPPPPDVAAMGWFFLAYLVFLAAMMLYQVACIAGFGEIALRTTPVLEAFVGGLAATGRNLPGLSVFGLGFLVLAIVAMLALGLVLMIVMLVISIVLPIVGPMLLQLALSLVFYPPVFVSYYLVWRSLLGAPPAAAHADAFPA